MKTNKKQLLLLSALTLLPAALGLVLAVWAPAWFTSRTVFGSHNAGTPMVIFLLATPLILLGFLWLCTFITAKDPGNQNRNQKTASVMLWIIPILSNFISALMLSVVLRGEAPSIAIVFLALGLLFTVIGNFMPKTKRNATIGVKVIWALASDENWNATHRFAGRVWFILGVGLMLLSGFTGILGPWVLLAVILVIAFCPMVYSYLYYRKQKRDGTAPDLKQVKDLYGTVDPRFVKISLAIVILILIGVTAIMFTGNITYALTEDCLEVKASFYSDLTVPYSDIDSVEYRETDDPGMRAMGWGSPRLLLGSFENDEFGMYTRYSYTGEESCVVLRSGDSVLVLTGRDGDATLALYRELQAKAGPRGGRPVDGK